MKKIRMETYNKLILDLKESERIYKNNKDQKIYKQIQDLKRHMDEILGQEVEKKARFTKQAYYELGPKSTKLLARRLRKQQADNTGHKIKDPSTNKLMTEPKEIEHIFKEYYKELYTQTSTVDSKSIRDFLNTLDLPSIGENQNKTITAEISLEEIGKAIGRLKTNKAPGSDGFPIEWYKIFRNELSPLLYRTFNWIMKEGKTPPSWKEAIVTLIPKENKDKENCNNYRPISILNVDYKIYTSIICKRFEQFMPDLIDEDQTGFISGRQTQDNIRRTLHVIHKIQKESYKAAVISLDAEKAFDRVNWEFLYQTLEKCGLTEDSIKCIKAIYQQPTARIKVNGSLSERFVLGRGTRQGCCLSPTLFAIYIESLAQAIRQDTELKGITIGSVMKII